MTQSLAIKGIFRTLVFVVVLALLLFLPAGSVRFWQGWLYLFVMVASTSAVGYSLWKTDPALFARRMRGGPLAEPRRVQRLIQGAMQILLVATIVTAGLDYRFGWSELPVVVVLLADLAIAVSFVLFWLVFRENTFAAATIVVEPGQCLVSTGPYAHVRHPMYAAALLMLVATPLALGSLWGLLFVIPLWAMLVARTLDEERLLASDLPGYDAYCRAVRWRLVPGLW
jgi:protein-S-isoprenylcysteine O-methyltransferase Ste14